MMKNSFKKFLAIPVFLIAAFLFAVAGTSMVNWLRLFWTGLPGWLFWAVLLFLTLSISLSYALPKGRLSILLHRIGEVWTWFFLYLFALVLIARLLGLLGVPIPLREAGFAVLGAQVVILAWGIPNGLRFKTTRYRLRLNKPCKGLRLAFISDLHLGFFTGRRMMQRITRRVNALDADIIVIGGDLFDDTCSGLRHPERAIDAFLSMKSTLGIWGCWGNHDDLYPDDPPRARFIRQAGIRILEDEVRDFGSFVLVGRKDIRSSRCAGEEALLAGVDLTKPVLVLDHSPARYKALWKAGADLVLSGHTHGGQSFPGNAAYRLLSSPCYGHLSQEGRHAVITSGAGIYGLPIRIGVYNEVVLIELEENS